MSDMKVDQQPAAEQSATPDSAHKTVASASSIDLCPACGAELHMEMMYGFSWIVCNRYGNGCLYRRLAPM